MSNRVLTEEDRADIRERFEVMVNVLCEIGVEIEKNNLEEAKKLCEGYEELWFDMSYLYLEDI